MRIKSYFAPSVQAAIALVHREFGHDVTLITSHVAALENRHLGEYEVVFAIEESAASSEPAVAAVEALPAAPQSPPELQPVPGFQQVLQQVLAAPDPLQQDLPARLEQIRTSLVALGLSAALVRSFMTLLDTVTGSPTPEPVSVPRQPPPLSQPSSEPECAVVTAPLPASVVPFLSHFTVAQPEPRQPSSSRFSAAELAFMSSVASAPTKGQGA